MPRSKSRKWDMPFPAETIEDEGSSPEKSKRAAKELNDSPSHEAGLEDTIYRITPIIASGCRI